jgi:hypothetical protein
MARLWSLAVAPGGTGGMGKAGVSGSSPEEGSAKVAKPRPLPYTDVASVRGVGLS